MPSVIKAHVSLESFGPYHQSKFYDAAKLEGESAADYDRRCWRNHQHVKNGTVHIPARAVHMALVDAASYMGVKIEGAGNKTWTKKFAAGIAIFDDIDLGVNAEKTDYIDIMANPQGERDGGKRVPKRLPLISEWECEFDVHILDPIITKSVFQETLETAGMYVGIGQYRPQRGGTAGRFRVVNVDWVEESRELKVRKRA